MRGARRQQFTPKYRRGDQPVDKDTTKALDRHRHYLATPSVQKRLSDSMHPALRAQFDLVRYINSTLSTIGRSEAIWKCSPESVFRCVLQAALYGIELSSGPMVQGYLIPFKGECALIVSWQGLLAVARRSGDVVDVTARCIYRDDKVTYQEGLQTVFVHEPNIFAVRNDDDIVAAYCVTHYRDGHKTVTIMPRSEIEKRREASPAWRNREGAKEPTPWEKWFPEMALKTVIKSAAKAWPKSMDLEKLLNDEAEKDGELEPNVFDSEEPLAKEQAAEAAEEPAKPDIGTAELRTFIEQCKAAATDADLEELRGGLPLFEGAELTAAKQAFDEAKQRLTPEVGGVDGFKAARRAARAEGG